MSARRPVPLACVFAVALLAAPLGGCARLVVIDPDLVASQNSRDWTIHREPGGAAPTAAPVAAAPLPLAPAVPAPAADDDDDN